VRKVVSYLLAVIAALALCAAIFVAPVWALTQVKGVPSTCVPGRTCDPSHDTLNFDGTITHYGK
jgi:hypothetical protein